MSNRFEKDYMWSGRARVCLRFLLSCLTVYFSLNVTVSRSALAQPDPKLKSYVTFPFDSGEELEYKVGYSFFYLGSVDLKQEGMDSTGDLYRLVSHSKSAPWLPFVHENVTNWAELRSSLPTNISFHFADSASSSWTTYSSDSSLKILDMAGVDNGIDSVNRVVKLARPCYDALGLMMLIRSLSGSAKDTSVSLVVNYKLEPVEIIFGHKLKAIKVDAFKQPVLARRFETRGNWSDTHSGGTDANISGWISADSAAIPLLIKMRILIGSVKVELASYHRPGWIPPTPLHRMILEADRSMAGN